MTQLLAEAAHIRAEFARYLLVHTYTRTPLTDGAENAWGVAAQNPSPVQLTRPCRLTVVERFRLDGLGKVSISVPILSIAHDDPLAVGDKVSSVLDAAGVVLLTGPLIVERLVVHAHAGLVLRRNATLRGAETR